MFPLRLRGELATVHALWSVSDGSRLATGSAHLPAGLWLWA